jgi:rhamnosyltransferase
MDSPKHKTEKNGMESPAALHPVLAPATENICAVVVTYFPDAGFAERLAQIRGQVDRVVVVDNGSDAESFRHVVAAASDRRVTLVRNEANLGIATALNQGMRHAHGEGYTWAFLLDQDTRPWTKTIERVRQAFDEIPEKEKVAVLGSNRFLKASASGAQWWTRSPAVITSGSLVSLRAAEIIGPFRDEFFIDGVDFEFCLRARSKGYEIVEILEPIMTHAIGNPKPVRLGWIRGRTSDHRSWRWYYMVRNNLILFRDYMWMEPAWTLKTAGTLCYALSLSLLFEEARLAKLRFGFLGLWDGIRRKFDRVII